MTTSPKLQRYNNLADIIKKYDSNKKEINELHDAVRDPNKASALLKIIMNNIYGYMSNIKTIHSAWVYLAVCKVLGLRYTDSTKMAIMKPTVADLAKHIPASALSGQMLSTTFLPLPPSSTPIPPPPTGAIPDLKGDSPSYTLEDIKKVQELGTHAEELVDALNNSRLYPLTLANLGGTPMTGGSLQSYNVNYSAIANMIKHNNNMLLAYGMSSNPVKNYTTEMHGGRTWEMAIDNKEHSVDFPEEGLVNTSVNSDHINTIVGTINSQIKALASKNKTLSNSSQDKVKVAINNLIKAEKEVTELLAYLSATNAYPNTATGNNATGYDATDNQTALDNLRDAIKEKTRRELKTLAISEGLGKAVSDAFGIGFGYMSGNDLYGNYIQ
jgi:hypothetical protein